MYRRKKKLLKPSLLKTELPSTRPINILSLNVGRRNIATLMIWWLSPQRANLTLLRDSGSSSKAGSATTVVPPPPKKKKDILNQQFSSIFTNENATSVPDMSSSPHPGIADINIHETGVGLRKILSDL